MHKHKIVKTGDVAVHVYIKIDKIDVWNCPPLEVPANIYSGVKMKVLSWFIQFWLSINAVIFWIVNKNLHHIHISLYVHQEMNITLVESMFENDNI